MITRHTARLLLLGVLLVTTSTQPVFLVGASFFQIGPELGIGPVGLGLLTAAFFLTSSVSSPLAGRWVQRVGWRRAMRVNCVASAAVMASTAVAARSAWSLAGFLMAAAAVYGMANPAANMALAAHTDPVRAATVFGIKHAGIPGSTLLAGLAVPVVVIGFGWRASFAVSAVLAALVWLLIPRSEREVHAGFGSQPRRGVPLDRSRLIGLAVASGLGATAATALGTYLVSAAIDTGMSETGAGLLQSVGSAISILARIVVGIGVDRRQAGGVRGLFLLFGGGAVTFAALTGANGWVFVILVVVAYATGWGWPGLMTFTVVDANRGTAAASSSVVQAGVFVGAGATPIVLGTAVERWGFDAVWVIVAAALLAGAGVARFIGRDAAADRV